MCKHGTHVIVSTIESGNVPVDACIADEIAYLNREGVITLGCCCSHGKAGQIVKWGNAHGKWKGYREPPHVIIKQESCGIAKRLGYRPYPYYYADGHSYRVWQMQLKTGCVTEEEVVEWHKQNTIKEVGGDGR
jgi:hypothetical protein